MKLLERKAAPGEAELVAALENARDELAQVQLAAEIKVTAAQGEVTLAQSRLDEWRRGLVDEHAAVWRTHAERLRQQAEETDELETTVVKVHVFGGQGDRVEPQLVFVRTQLLEQADQSDARATHLEARLAIGDALNAGESLALLVSQLEPLPDVDLVPA
jgi:hypothetical protein